MSFKFLTKNENTLFDNRIINLCSDFFSMFIADYDNNVVSNRQLTIADLGTFYIIEFEHVLDWSSYFGRVVFVYEYLPSTKLTIYLRDNNILSVTTSNT